MTEEEPLEDLPAISAYVSKLLDLLPDQSKRPSNEEFLLRSHGFTEAVNLKFLALNGDIGAQEYNLFRLIVERIAELFYQSAYGDGLAKKTLEEKLYPLLYPERYQSPRKSTINPSFARVYELRKVMQRLSRVVVPIEGEDTGKGKVQIKSYETIGRDIEFYPKGWKEDWETAREKLHSKPMSLQRLAMKIYLEELRLQGIEIDDTKLYSDLHTVQKWEDAHPDRIKEMTRLAMWGTNDLPYQEYNVDWKLRRLSKKIKKRE